MNLCQAFSMVWTTSTIAVVMLNFCQYNWQVSYKHLSLRVPKSIPYSAPQPVVTQYSQVLLMVNLMEGLIGLLSTLNIVISN